MPSYEPSSRFLHRRWKADAPANLDLPAATSPGRVACRQKKFTFPLDIPIKLGIILHANVKLAIMSTVKCPNCGADIGGVIAAHAGRATSTAKAEAARRNAKLGGWQKGRPRKMKKQLPLSQ